MVSVWVAGVVVVGWVWVVVSVVVGCGCLLSVA